MQRASPVATQGVPFQTLGLGSTGSAIHPATLERSRLRANLIAASAVLAVGIVAAGVMLALRKDPVAELGERVSSGAYGVAEAFFLEHFEYLSQQPESFPSAREALRRQRQAERLEERAGIHWDSSYQLAPSTWKGRSVTQDQKSVYPFTLVFQKVTDTTLEGYLDWPDHGIRAGVRGIHDGNHLVFWDYKILEGSGPYLEHYVLNQKFSTWIVGDRLVAAEGPHHESFEATRAP
jgi:hypothetical protein